MNSESYVVRRGSKHDIEMLDIDDEYINGKAGHEDQEKGLTAADKYENEEIALEHIASQGIIDIMELEPSGKTQEPDVFRFLDLPREIRDDIHERIVTLDSHLSDRKSHFKCTSASCTGRPRAGPIGCKEQFKWIRLYSTICRQVHCEVVDLFFRVNAWELHRPRLRDDLERYPNPLELETRQMLMKLHKKQLMKHFKHLTMQICISPLAYVDLGTITDLQNSSPRALWLHHVRHDPHRLRRHTLDLKAQCEMFRQTLLSFSEIQHIFFPQLQTLTLEMSLHGHASPGEDVKHAFDRCGLKFKIKLNLDAQRSVSRPVPKLPRAGSPKDHATSIIDPTKLEPLRRMLSPLMMLSGVRTVEVIRRWVVIHHAEGGDGKVHITIHDDGTVEEEGLLTTHMVLHETFRSVRQMLIAGKANFAHFRKDGLEASRIDRDNVVKIYEDGDNGLAQE